MKNLSVRDYIFIIFAIYFAVIAFSFLSLSKEWVSNQEIDLKIKKEVHIANLICRSR